MRHVASEESALKRYLVSANDVPDVTLHFRRLRRFRVQKYRVESRVSTVRTLRDEYSCRQKHRDECRPESPVRVFVSVAFRSLLHRRSKQAIRLKARFPYFALTIGLCGILQK